MDPLTPITLTILFVTIVCIYALCSRLEKAEEKIRSLEVEVVRMPTQTELKAFAEKWDAELDKPYNYGSNLKVSAAGGIRGEETFLPSTRRRK